MDQITNDILVSVENAEVTTVAMREAVTQSQNLKKRLCYKFAWRPDLDLLSHRQVLEYCESKRPHQAASDVEFLEDLGFILINFLSEAVGSLTERDLSSTAPHIRQYVKWSRFELDRFHAGSLPNLSCSHSKWNNLLRDTDYRRSLISRVESTKQGKFYTKIGRNLLQMLKGQLDPLTYLFQDDSIPEFYREMNSKVTGFGPLNKYLDAMSHENPDLKIMEIGAGTGATTEFILEGLSSQKEEGVYTLDCTQYDYTDISPAFFESAATKFEKNHGRMRFKVLDIEIDPAKQGFELGTYDLIFAAAVCHGILE